MANQEIVRNAAKAILDDLRAHNGKAPFVYEIQEITDDNFFCNKITVRKYRYGIGKNHEFMVCKVQSNLGKLNIYSIHFAYSMAVVLHQNQQETRKHYETYFDPILEKNGIDENKSFQLKESFVRTHNEKEITDTIATLGIQYSGPTVELLIRSVEQLQAQWHALARLATVLENIHCAQEAPYS